MKKLLLVCAIALCSSFSNAQTTVTFIVDINDFLANGGTINNVVSIAGNFTTQTGDLPDWTPADGAMTNMGNNIWSKTVIFSAPNGVDSLNFKYVQGADWPDGDEGNEWLNADDASCKRPADNNNRKFLVPASGAHTYFSKWAECPLTAIRGQVAELKATDVFPNPATNSLTVRAGVEPITGVRIIAADGKEVLNRAFSSVEAATMDLSSLSAGIYRVLASTKNSVSQKQFSVVR